MRRGLLLSVIGLALLWVPIPTPDTVQAAYTDACTTLKVSQTLAIRGFGHVFEDDDIRGVIGDARVRNLNPCTSPTIGHFDGPAVLPANLQRPGTSGDLVQIGYVECGAPGSASCGNVPADGDIHFMYVCDDLSGGTPCLADGWAGTPVMGRRYRFRVQYNQFGTGKWDYSIQDLTTGDTKTKSVTSHWHAGDLAWWGSESHDYGSTLGPKHLAGNGINMYWMQYYRSSVGNWMVVTDLDRDDDFVAISYKFDAGGNRVPLTQPFWYTRSIADQNYNNDEVQIWTEDH